MEKSAMLTSRIMRDVRAPEKTPTASAMAVTTGNIRIAATTLGTTR